MTNQQRRFVGLFRPGTFSESLAFKENQFSRNRRRMDFHVEGWMSLVRISNAWVPKLWIVNIYNVFVVVFVVVVLCSSFQCCF